MAELEVTPLSESFGKRSLTKGDLEEGAQTSLLPFSAAKTSDPRKLRDFTYFGLPPLGRSAAPSRMRGQVLPSPDIQIFAP